MNSVSAASMRLEAGTDLTEMGPDCYSLHLGGGEALHVNANATSLFGREPLSLLGAAFLDMVSHPDRVGVARAIAVCVGAGRETSACFRLAAAPAGRSFEMTCRPAPRLRDGDSRPVALAVTRDISARVALEEDLRQAREKAEGLSIAKSRFLANMSHELRTPLNAILGFSELLQSEAMRPIGPEREREYAGLIHGSARHLLSVLNDILDMSKIEAGKYEIVREPFDLSHALSACCAMMRGQAQTRGIDLRPVRLRDLPEINADERAVKQIVINLLSNALKFTEPGGHVEVCAWRTGRTVRISVADNGIGISPEHMDGLGTPFYQADSKYDRRFEGTGLGLSVVRGLTELHGGRVEFDSAKDAGTTVTVILPIASVESRPVPAREEFELVRLPCADPRPSPAASAGDELEGNRLLRSVAGSAKGVAMR